MQNDNDGPASPAPDASTAGNTFRFSKSYANYVLGVLFVVYVFNFVDRQLVSVLIGPIKEEFGASDTQMGLLIGFAFALLYTFAGIPIARWADRSNRRNIIALGLAVWSAMTVASGMARSFTQLLIARIGVGLGEAAGTPPAHSLIADYFPVNKRATAIAIYTSGVFVGASMAYLGGGYLREHFDWRTAFYVLGIPGLLFALVVRFTVREPPRGLSDAGASEVGTSTLSETLRYLLGSRSWVYLITGSSLLSINGFGVLMWGYEFFSRVHDMTPFETGKWMALIMGVGGVAGTLGGGRLTDRLIVKRPGMAISGPGLVTLIGIPFGLVWLLADQRWLSLLCLFPYYALLNVYVPMSFSVNQSLAKPSMRATASAIVLFAVNIFGAGAGPFIVGAISDFYTPQYGHESLRYALVVVTLGGILGCGFLLLSSRHFAADLQRNENGP